MNHPKVNWLKIREPLRGACVINTVDGPMEIYMHEPDENETKHILKTYPLPPKPMRTYKVPVDRDGKQTLDTITEPDMSPEAIKRWEESSDHTLELQAMAYAEAAIDETHKPEGDTVEARIEVLMTMPRAVRIRLINFAQSLGEKRLAERFEEAKKS
jgi:hypothetical protein